MGLDPANLPQGVLRAMSREPALSSPVAINWPGIQKYVGNCDSCDALFNGNKREVLGKCCYRCALQGRPPKPITEKGEPACPVTGFPATDFIDAWLPCIPPTRTAQQKGAFIQHGKGAQKPRIRFFTKKEVKGAANELRRILGPIVPQEPLSGPLKFHVTFVYPWLKCMPKRLRGEPQPIITRPDCSNTIKLLEDLMTDMGFWNDDSQIYDLRVRKFRGNEPGISIKIGK